MDDRSDFLLQQVHYGLRRSGWDEYAGHGFRFLVPDAKFIERRHIGQSFQTLLAGKRERTLPAWINAIVVLTALQLMGVNPPSRDCASGAPPANGTVTKFTSSACLSISIANDGVVPAPGEATLYLPGLAFINSINSFIVLAGNSELTSHEFGEAPALVTGMKSFSMSNRIDLYRLGFTTMLDDESKIV